MLLERKFSGTSPSTIRCAIPSAMAVLPTPGSPTSIGLFFVRRERICSTRRHSSSRPITGSSLPVRASSLRFIAYLPNASNSFSAVCESTVAPLRNCRTASIRSLSVAPFCFSSSAATPRSATRARSRCSTDAYLSLNFFVKSTARCTTFVISPVKYSSLPPDTFGSRDRASDTPLRKFGRFTPTRPSRKEPKFSSSATKTANRCSGSTACCPACRATETALCSACCAFIVNTLMFIVVKFWFLTSVVQLLCQKDLSDKMANYRENG